MFTGLSRLKVISDGISSGKKNGNALIVICVFLVVSIFVTATVFSHNMYLRAVQTRRSTNVRYAAFNESESDNITTDGFDAQIRR